MSLNFTSLYGRWLGVTYGSSAGSSGGQSKYLSGDLQGTKFKNFAFGSQGNEAPMYGSDALQTLTSGTTATVVSNSGVTVFNSSSTLTWNMAAPTNPTARKYLVSGTSVNGIITVTLSAGKFSSTAGATGTSLTLNSAGEAACLVAITTGLWAVVSNNSSAAIT